MGNPLAIGQTARCTDGRTDGERAGFKTEHSARIDWPKNGARSLSSGSLESSVRVCLSVVFGLNSRLDMRRARHAKYAYSDTLRASGRAARQAGRQADRQGSALSCAEVLSQQLHAVVFARGDVHPPVTVRGQKSEAGCSRSARYHQQSHNSVSTTDGQ